MTLGVLVLLAIGAVVTSSGCASFGGVPAGARLARLEQSPQYKDGVFFNEESTTMMGDVGTKVLAEFLFGNGAMRVPSCALPLFKGTGARLAGAPASGLRVTWLGHSTSIIELDGVRVLSDPMWSERASPFTVAGPKRFHPPPLPLGEVGKLDAVIVSHDHYDHLDMATVQALSATGVVFHVGLGVGAHLERWGVPAAQIAEHAWWDEVTLPGGVRLVSVPSRHFSGRLPTRNNTTQWTSWALVGPRHRLFFSGDTGKTALHAEIGKRLGPFDVAMLEIGQYHPSWGKIHLGPVGALETSLALDARRLLPIHWATFELGLHAWSEPAETLVTEAKPRGVALVTPMLGEPIEPEVDQGSPWWRALPPLASRCPQGAELAVRSLDDWAL